MKRLTAIQRRDGRIAVMAAEILPRLLIACPRLAMPNPSGVLATAAEILAACLAAEHETATSPHTWQTPMINAASISLHEIERITGSVMRAFDSRSYRETVKLVHGETLLILTQGAAMLVGDIKYHGSYLSPGVFRERRGIPVNDAIDMARSMIESAYAKAGRTDAEKAQINYNPDKNTTLNLTLPIHSGPWGVGRIKAAISIESQPMAKTRDYIAHVLEDVARFEIHADRINQEASAIVAEVKALIKTPGHGVTLERVDVQGSWPTQSATNNLEFTYVITLKTLSHDLRSILWKTTYGRQTYAGQKKDHISAIKAQLAIQRKRRRIADKANGKITLSSATEAFLQMLDAKNTSKRARMMTMMCEATRNACTDNVPNYNETGIDFNWRDGVIHIKGVLDKNIEIDGRHLGIQTPLPEIARLALSGQPLEKLVELPMLAKGIIVIDKIDVETNDQWINVKLRDDHILVEWPVPKEKT